MRTVWPLILMLGFAGCAEGGAVQDDPAQSGGAGDAGEERVREGHRLPAELEEIRRLTARFADVEVAEAEGYVPDPSGMCITAEIEGQPRQLGAMGIHYFRPDLLGLTADAPRVDGNGTHTDFRQPAVLVYLPRDDGTLELAAVENLVWVKAWHEAGHRGPPSFQGRDYYRMVDNPLTEDVDEAHGFEPHYELHVWLHVENPAGLFVPFNPAASCDAHPPGA